MRETYQRVTSIIGIIIISIILFKFTHLLLSIIVFIVGIGLVIYFSSTEGYKTEKIHTKDTYINVSTSMEGVEPIKLTDDTVSQQSILTDIVLTWVDSSDIEWNSQKLYYYNNEDNNEDNNVDNNNNRFPNPIFSDIELETSILLVIKNISWKKNIYIVTSDGHIPKCYDKLREIYHNIFIIYHSTIWPKHLLHTLPTFNSHAIECNIHRIPNLTENFLYLNDDFYIVNKLNYNDFFYNNLLVIQPFKYNKYLCGKNGVYYNVWCNLHDKYNMYPPYHTPFSLNKSIINMCEMSLKKWWEDTISSRFRSNTDIAPIGYVLNYCVQNAYGYYNVGFPFKINEFHSNGVYTPPNNNIYDIININSTDNIYESIQNLREKYL